MWPEEKMGNRVQKTTNKTKKTDMVEKVRNTILESLSIYRRGHS